LVAAPAAAPAAPSSAPSGKIAFTRFNGQKMNLLVYDLAADKIIAELPNLRHPDLAGGLLLANGEGGGQETIIRMSDTGGNPRPITAHPEDAYPQWSPSMASLAFASTAYGDRRSRLFYQEDAGAQFEAPPMLYNERELFGDNPVYLDNWRIAFQGCNTWAGGSKCGIYSADSKGGEPVQATSLTADTPTGNLGAEILFMSNRSGNYDVWAVNWDGGNLRQLTDNPAVDGLAAASPDYQHIAFVTNRDGVWSVYAMNVNGSNQRKLFDINGSYGSGDYEWYRERISWGP
jgi:Tol biopolymer transport system component